MKIALIGYGRMGRLIHELANAKGYEVVAIIASNKPLDISSIKEADICIDFSIPQAVLNNVKTLSFLKKNIVLGTTGWDNDLPAIENMVKQEGIGLLYAPNFSIGVGLFLKMIEYAAQLMIPFKQYDATGIEMHHKNKVDAPSGTAKIIEKLVHQLHCPISFTSVRSGNTPGTHTMIYDSPNDTITLSHVARNREGFAEGALVAAEWLMGKKGIFTLDAFLNEYLHEKI